MTNLYNNDTYKLKKDIMNICDQTYKLLSSSEGKGLIVHLKSKNKSKALKYHTRNL